MEIKIKIENLNEVKAALAQSPHVVGKHINKAIEGSLRDIRDDTISTARFKHGHGSAGILGSIEMRMSNLRGEVGPTKEYTIPLHEGHRQTPGRYVAAIGKRLVRSFVTGNPFFRTSVERSNMKVNNRFKQGLSDALSEIARSA